MHTNGTVLDTPPERPARPATEDRFMELSDVGRAVLADERWVSEQYSLGTFDAYKGEYIAVVDKTVLGHGKKLLDLRQQVSDATGIPTSRIVTSLIIRKPFD